MRKFNYFIDCQPSTRKEFFEAVKSADNKDYTEHYDPIHNDTKYIVHFYRGGKEIARACQC